ncbi:hypothetical protein Cs7R123_23040 [Catellatospora sp. TT07R-123]|uniref:hypothetical protein n=1 Tax=Catellatospora sp. TT07R-123 TaxID=2733863 RepID=UPI001B0DCF96|nr:hypothetical protein [Catellatospora sp. TT07R-123]GHJ44962.1 hypothetical protein Cs7R123_23040 [Catellatospora sp. TT07R-123]
MQEPSDRRSRFDPARLVLSLGAGLAAVSLLGAPAAAAAPRPPAAAQASVDDEHPQPPDADEALPDDDRA